MGWNDTFVINLKDLEYDDLTLAAFVNDKEVGSTNLSLADISSTAAGNYDSIFIHLFRRVPNQIGEGWSHHRKFERGSSEAAEVVSYWRIATTYNHSPFRCSFCRGKGNLKSCSLKIELLQLYGWERQILGILPLQI